MSMRKLGLWCTERRLLGSLQEATGRMGSVVVPELLDAHTDTFRRDPVFALLINRKPGTELHATTSMELELYCPTQTYIKVVTIQSPWADPALHLARQGLLRKMSKLKEAAGLKAHSFGKYMQPTYLVTGGVLDTQCVSSTWHQLDTKELLLAGSGHSHTTIEVPCTAPAVVLKCGESVNVFPNLCQTSPMATSTDLRSARPRPHVAMVCLDGTSRWAMMYQLPEAVGLLEALSDASLADVFQFPNFHAAGLSTAENIPFVILGARDEWVLEDTIFAKFQANGYATAATMTMQYEQNGYSFLNDPSIDHIVSADCDIEHAIFGHSILAMDDWRRD